MAITDVLVVGGGIAGIEAALVLARAGRRVYLVEREPTLGGHMAAFDRIFPALDDAPAILASKMTAVRAHPAINLWTCSEVTRVEGEAGAYRVEVTRRPRYVDEERCTGCLECVDACVYDARFPDPFNLGLGTRKPVYLPFANATPAAVAIDATTCSALTAAEPAAYPAPAGAEVSSGASGTGCGQPCVAACGDRHAIDFGQKAEVKTIGVGAIVLATGFRVFDVSRAAYYGYGSYPNVYTSLEVEHMLNRRGPTRGAIRLRDGLLPRSIGIVHCVGSRDVATNRWCSGVCCMTALKLAHLLRERTGAEVFNFYVDMRTPGVQFEAFYQQLLDEAVHFVRGRVATVTDWALDPSEEGRLVICAEDTLLGGVRRVAVDMVVLSVGLEPRADAPALARLFDIGCSADGFFVDPAPALGQEPAVAGRDEGVSRAVFPAGCCEGPRGLRDTIAHADAAAARVLSLPSRERP